MMEFTMKTLLLAGVAALALSASMAVAQTSESTTSQSTTMAPDPAVPPPGTLSTTREAHAVDSNGNQIDSKASSYRDSNGVAEDKSSTTTSMPPAPPPPPVTTSTTTTDTTSGPH
jgi:hypothetical protein